MSVPVNHTNAVDVLLSTLAELEMQLAPLFATPTTLQETLARMDVEQRCQLELMVAYAINTLAFINLKANGVAPASHPVMKELERIKGYTVKFRQATGQYKARMNVDKGAAERFIKGALAANDRLDASEEAAASAAASSRSSATNTPKTSRHPSPSAAMVDYEGTHQRFDTQTSTTATTTTTTSSSSKSTSSSSKTSSSSNRKRPMDPFAGYQEDSSRKSRK